MSSYDSKGRAKELMADAYKHQEIAEQAFIDENYDLCLSEYQIACLRLIHASDCVRHLMFSAFFPDSSLFMAINADHMSCRAAMAICYSKKIQKIIAEVADSLNMHSSLTEINSAGIKLSEANELLQLREQLERGPSDVIVKNKFMQQQNKMLWYKNQCSSTVSIESIADLIIRDAIIQKCIDLGIESAFQHKSIAAFHNSVIEILHKNWDKFEGQPFPQELADSISNLIYSRVQKIAARTYFFHSEPADVCIEDVDSVVRGVENLIIRFKAVNPAPFLRQVAAG